MNERSANKLNVSAEVVCDLRTRWPRLEELRKARAATVEKFFQQAGRYREPEK